MQLAHWIALIPLAFVACAAMPTGTQARGDGIEFDLEQHRFSGAEQVEDGQKFNLDLGTQRRNWTHARWSVVQLDEPMDLSDFHAAELAIRTGQPRRDAGITLALREAGGTWYSHPWACDLAAAENTGIARFDDFDLPMYHNPPHGRFQDPEGRFDTSRITAIAIGIVNPLGIGEVSFTVTGLRFIELPQEPPQPTEIEVTGRLLDINRTEHIPAGVFGGFHLGENRHERYRLAANRTIHHDALSGSPRFGDDKTHIWINTMGDRVRPSPRITHGNWEERSETIGRRFGERAKEDGRPLYVEYWNEPYLNWANFNRANFGPHFYNRDEAEEGATVRIRHCGTEAPHLIWTRDRRYYLPEIFGYFDRRYGDHLDHWRRGRDGDGNVPSRSHAEPYGGMGQFYEGQWRPQSHPPKDVPDGETYEWQGRTLTAFTPWHVVDTTQFTYWSGAGMLKHYIEPAVAFGRGLKEANPDAVYFVGWGNRPGEDHWAAWDLLYKPTIDATIDLIDGYNEHDYGSDPLNMAGQYEVVTAYGVTEHGKWLYAYNTETASSSDPQVYQDAATRSADLNKFEWVSRKIIHALDFVPDKARVMLHFGDGARTSQAGTGWWSDDGEGIAMDLLRNLRGRLVQVVKDDNHVYVVASIDGADPRNPRPDDLEADKELVVAVLNDHPHEREVMLTIAAPEGTRFTGHTLRSSRVADGAVSISERNMPHGDRRARWRESIEPRGIRVFTLPLEGDLPEQSQVIQRQFFGPEIIREVTPDEPLTQTIDIDMAAFANVERAWVTLSVQRLGHDLASVEVNGRSYTLPAAVTPENITWLRRVPIDVADLKEQTELTLRVNDSDRAGFFLGAASIFLEGEPAR